MSNGLFLGYTCPLGYVLRNLVDKGGSEPMSENLIMNFKFDQATMASPFMSMV